MGRPKHVNISLEATRGIAALLVVANHAFAALYSASNRSVDIFHGRITQEFLLLAPMLFGKAAVGLFFLLSGYLVGGQVLRQCHAGTLSPRLYLINRFSRLWFVLATGILLTAFLDFISRRIFPDLNGTGFAAVSQGQGTTSLSYFVCNLGFLQGGRCPAYGSNVPLWSIGYEWYFYLLFRRW